MEGSCKGAGAPELATGEESERRKETSSSRQADEKRECLYVREVIETHSCSTADRFSRRQIRSCEGMGE